MTDFIALQFAMARALITAALSCLDEGERLVLAAKPKPPRTRPRLVVDNPVSKENRV